MLLSGCGDTKQTDQDLDGFYRVPINTIAIAPIRNNSGGLLFVPRMNNTAVVDPQAHSEPVWQRQKSVSYLFREFSTLYLTQQGFLALSQEDVDRRMAKIESEHIVTEEALMQLFGTDAVMFITIHSWDISNINKQQIITIDADFELRRVEDGAHIWQYRSLRNAISINDKSQASQHDFYIAKFLNIIFSRFPKKNK